MHEVRQTFIPAECVESLVWVSETRVERRGDTLIATSELMHSRGGSFALDRSALRFTVLGSKHAVDIRGCDAG